MPSWFTVKFAIHSFVRLFYTQTRHFPPFASRGKKRLSLLTTYVHTRCFDELENLDRFVLSESVYTRCESAPMRNVRARRRVATFVIWISRSSVRSTLRLMLVRTCVYTYTYICICQYVSARAHIHMHAHIGSICTHYIEAWDFLRQFSLL